jgi:hypothetical protein
MIRTPRTSHVLALLALVTFGAAPLGAPAADPPSYDDPGMHFAPPPDFEKVDVQPGDPTGSDDSDSPVPIALFVYHKGKGDQRVISITVSRFDGPVDEYDTSHVSELRKGGDEAFVVKNEKTALANGMPAYYLKITSGASAGQFVERIEYIVCDGTRSIDVAYSGQQGTFDDDTAKAALKSLYVVVYPKRRT